MAESVGVGRAMGVCWQGLGRWVFVGRVGTGGQRVRVLVLGVGEVSRLMTRYSLDCPTKSLKGKNTMTHLIKRNCHTDICWHLCLCVVFFT